MILCLAVPYFAAAVERRDDAALARRPLVIGGRPWEAQPVYAYSQEAARQGVRPGLTLRQAHLLFPHSHFLPAAQARYRTAAGEMVDLLAEATPLLTPEALWHPQTKRGELLSLSALSLPARCCLDLEGLPLEESLPLACHLGRRVRAETRLAPAIGLAAHPFTAQIAAYLTRPNHARPVSPEEEAAFLAGRSLNHLPLERETARRLKLLGVRVLGQLAALPWPALQEQFGPAIEPFYRLARGEAGAVLRPAGCEPAIHAGRRFDEPVVDAAALAALCDRLAGSLAGQLQKGGLECGALELVWERDGGGSQTGRLPLRRPTNDPARLQAALQSWLTPARLGGGLTALKVQAAATGPARAYQLALLARPAAGEHLPALLGSLIARYGGDRFFQAVLTEADHPLPERRFALRPWATPAAVTAASL